MEVLDLFSAAAGGWSLGMHRAGFTTIAACEVEAWRRALYAENNPHVRLYDDVRTLTADRLRADFGRLPSVVVGSPPCQDISSANTKGKGVEGERSGLYFEAVRLVGECRPRWFAFENSANLRTRGADAVIAALEAIGYTCWPCVVRAGDVGANHERPRAWVLGCDLTQVADPDGERWDEGWGWGRGGLDVSVPADTRDAAQDGCGPGLPGRRPVTVERLPVEACRDAADPDSGQQRQQPQPSQWRACGAEQAGREDDDQPSPADVANTTRVGRVARSGGVESERAALNGRFDGDDNAHGAGDAPNPDQARQAHGCVEPGLRQAEIADDGRGTGRRNDGSIARQMGLCSPDCGAAFGHRADWSLADLADHLRLDDGLSARLAGTRVALGDGKGQSAASLIVEAFGDAVIPQIPEAIGRSILRTEAALSAIYARSAA